MTTLEDIFRLEEMAPDVWRGWTPENSGRPDIFGGQVAAQALRAATHTVDPSHLANSVHCSFLRRGRPDLPLDAHVERLRAGRTYSSRRVEVHQDNKVIFTMVASFHLSEPGPEIDMTVAPATPGPDELAPSPGIGAWSPPIETRRVVADSPDVHWWGRVEPTFPADPALHLCALLYASDLYAGGPAMAAVGVPIVPPSADIGVRSGSFGSLDHCIWFHRIPRVDEWFFCEVRALQVRDSRGVILGTMFDEQGRHLATFTQEMFLKLSG
jgi:acyl-CoA thioesterase II